ncbi:MAG: type II secretion system inner membrane protein GspF [bacterium]
MPVFLYRATDREGKIITGTMEAKDKPMVINKLQDLDYFPLTVSLNKVAGGGFSEILKNQRIFERIGQKDILNFTQQLSTLVGAGIPLDKSLTTLSQLTNNQKLTDVIEDIHKNVHGGSQFADALAQYPKLFSKLYIGMIKAGERGGVLEAVLARLSDFLESARNLKESVINALIYPLLLTFVGGIAVTVLLIFVVPKFSTIFADMGTTLPLPTAILLEFSQFLAQFWWALSGLLLIAYMVWKYYIATPTGRWKWDGFKLKMPLFGTLVQKIEIARFTRTLGTLIESGVPILQSLKIVKDILGNVVISEAIDNVQSGIKEGERISGPLKESGLFPALAVHMIDVGEETGQLEEMMFKVADVFEKESSNAVKRMVGLLEPVLILVMGVLIGFIVISMLLAIFSINELPI